MSLISDDERKRMFFYADSDGSHYDITAELTQPHLDLIHDTMVDLVEYSVTWKREKPLERPFYVLVVASGTGAETLRLLKRNSDIRIIAVDFSPLMNHELRRKFDEQYPRRDFDSYVKLIEEDFFGDRCGPDALLSFLPASLQPRAFDVVVGSFFLHHYSFPTKQEFFRRSQAVLRPNGALVLCEPFAFESASLTDFAYDFDERWIRKQFMDPDVHLRSKRDALGSDAAGLCSKWIEHRANTHICGIDAKFTSAPILTSERTTPSHASMALAAGFQEIGFPFRLWETGILWARRAS